MLLLCRFVECFTVFQTKCIVVVIVDARTAEITRSCGRPPVLLRFSSTLKLIHS